MPENHMRYHTAGGDIHNGTSADCKLCKARKTTADRLKRNKATGKLGGNVTAKKAPKRKGPTCRVCGKGISYRTVTGLCINCFNAKRAESMPAKEQPAARKVRAHKISLKAECSKCGKPISGRGSTGLCRVCVLTHPAVMQSREEHKQWMGVIIRKEAPAPLPLDGEED